MAHRVDSLPWTALANSFIYLPQDQYGRADFVPRDLHNNGRIIEHFVSTFHQKMSDDVSLQQSKLQARFQEEPQSSQTIDKEARRKMKRSIRYAQNQHCAFEKYFGTSTRHIENWSSFGKYDSNIWTAPPECLCRIQGCGYNRTLMMVEIFLLHDHLEPLFRLTQQPQIKFDALYNWGIGGYGWSQVIRSALWPYMALNVLHTKPETWPSQLSGKDSTERDYRLTMMYQRMLFKCTGTETCDIFALPHRSFFGIPHGALSGTTFLAPKFHSKIEDMFEEELHVTTAKELLAIRLVLQAKGLPVELVDQVMELADLDAPGCRLSVPGNPFHPKNRSKLTEYLAYCWQLMCNCNILARWCGKDINWELEVRMCIKQLFFDPDKEYHIPWRGLASDHTIWINSRTLDLRFA